VRVFAFVERDNVQDITSIVRAQEEIEGLRQASKIHEAEISTNLKKIVELQDFIVKNCPHSTVSRKSKYSSGGYDYRSVTTDWQECTICGQRFNERKTYGGFQ
jgi:hypothetical protein